MKITALDPGGTTGCASIEWDGTAPRPEMLTAWAQVPFEDLPDWLMSEILYDPPDLFVVERFFISPRTVTFTRQPEALYAIGGVLFLAKLHDIPVRMQSASDAKTAWPNSRLTDWAVKGRHARDALRHALLACQAHEVYRMYADTDRRRAT